MWAKEGCYVIFMFCCNFELPVSEVNFRFLFQMSASEPMDQDAVMAPMEQEAVMAPMEQEAAMAPMELEAATEKEKTRKQKRSRGKRKKDGIKKAEEAHKEELKKEQEKLKTLEDSVTKLESAVAQLAKEDTKARKDTGKLARLQMRLTEREAEIGRLNGKLAAEMSKREGLERELELGIGGQAEVEEYRQEILREREATREVEERCRIMEAARDVELGEAKETIEKLRAELSEFKNGKEEVQELKREKKELENMVWQGRDRLKEASEGWKAEEQARKKAEEALKREERCRNALAKDMRACSCGVVRRRPQAATNSVKSKVVVPLTSAEEDKLLETSPSATPLSMEEIDENCDLELA